MLDNCHKDNVAERLKQIRLQPDAVGYDVITQNLE